MKRQVLIFLIFFGLIILFTHGIFSNYFEQDEWGAFGDLIYSKNNLSWWSFLISRGIHFSPFGYIFWLVLYKFFSLNASWYVFVGLFLHSVASFFAYLLAYKITNSHRIGILTGILFATNGRAYQAFTHLAVFSTFVNASIFISLFFIYLSSLRKKHFGKRNILTLFIIFICAVFFREEGFILVPMFPVYLFLFDKKKLSISNIMYYVFLLAGFVLFLLIRFFSQSLNVIPIPDGSKVSFLPAFYNLPTLPIKLIVQNLIEGNRIQVFVINSIGSMYSDAGVTYHSSYPVFMDLAYLVIFNMVIILFGFMIYLFKIKIIFKYIIFALMWIMSSSLILSFIGRHLYILDSRYVYFSSIPILMVLSIIIVKVFEFKSENNVAIYVGRSLMVIVLLFLLATSYLDIQVAVKSKAFTGNARQKILSSMNSIYPRLPDNTIIYLKCRTECYRNAREFGLPTTYKFPFLAGAGWTILVNYAAVDEKTWGKFFKDTFLLNRGDQGYKRIGNHSFGYFIDKKLLTDTLKKNNLSTDIVIALEYNEEEFVVKDISNNFRKEINEK